MRKLILLVLSLTIFTFANQVCNDMRRQLSSVIETQHVVTCRVAGVEKGRTDILGLFFTMADEQVVLLYGNTYDTMLYTMDDPFVKNAHCIQNEQFRAVKRGMTKEQIVDKLMSFKHCK